MLSACERFANGGRFFLTQIAQITQIYHAGENDEKMKEREVLDGK